ncbi:MAG: hypothetical protein WA133_08800 [Syntrophales bacterium]
MIKKMGGSPPGKNAKMQDLTPKKELKSKEFIKTISINGGDRLRIRIATEKGRVANIMVQYEANIAGIWREIVRYDCAHGFLHRDVILPKGKTEKQPLSIANLNDALQYAEQDIKDRWQWYKERYVRGLKK